MTAPPLHGPERLTFVFTAVEGSATLWDRAPEATRLALERHDALLRELLAETGGEELRAQGDTFLLAWKDAAQAVQFCLRVQERLLHLDWPDEVLEHPEAAVVLDESGACLFRGLRVGMGVHTGMPLHGGSPRWSGPCVRRAGRLAGAAHGGQVLLTEVSWRESTEGLADLDVVDLGPHRFHSLAGTVRILEARAPAVAGRRFPPLRSTNFDQTNATPEPNALVGRDDDLAALGELISLGVRLVTVIGPPGIGSSRLLREFAARNNSAWAGEDQGGLWICDLTDARGRTGLLQAVGGVLDVPLTLGRVVGDSEGQIGHAAASRGPILLVLDGFEAVMEEGLEVLEAWLRLAPTLRLLVSAERRLGIEGEVTYEVAPLEVPQGDHPATSAAVRLLMRRLRERGERVRLGASQQRDAGRLLELAGGLPLAVEMLAGQLGAHPVAELEADVAGRLHDHGHASGPQRLTAVFDACLARLRPWERGALARCTVFEGGFDLAAAEAIIDLSEWAGAPSVSDAVERLRELGLLRYVEDGASPGAFRFFMHPFVRRSIAKSLPPLDREATEDRHVAYYTEWAATWAGHAHSIEGAEARSRMEEERGNLLAAVYSSLALRPATATRVDRALKGGLAMVPMLQARGPFETELSVLDDVLQAVRDVPGADPGLVVRVGVERGRARWLRGRWAEAREDLEQALQLARSHGDLPGEARSLEAYGHLLRLLGRPDEAIEVLTAGLERAQQLGMKRTEGLVRGSLGVALLQRAQVEEARTQIELAVTCFDAVGDRAGEGVQIGNLGVIHRRLGNLDRTQELYWEALDIHRETGDRRREGVMLGNLGVLRYHVGDLAGAFDLYDQSLVVAREVGDRRSEATALANIGLVYMERNNFDDAMGLFHQALALNRDVGERTGEGCDVGFLGALHHLQGDLEKARDHYKRALELLDPGSSRRYTGSFLSWAAACEADLGQADDAVEMFRTAAAFLQGAGDPHLLAAHDVLQGAIDLALARRRVEQGDQVAAALAREAARERMARARAEVSQTGDPISGDLRLASKWLIERLGDLA